MNHSSLISILKPVLKVLSYVLFFSRARNALPHEDEGHRRPDALSAGAHDDIGHAVGVSFDDKERRRFLKTRWRPVRKEDFPVSHHTKKGVVRPRRLNQNHLERFKWLAVSRLEGKRGAWCTDCVLFGVSKECGGRGGSGQVVGKLVTRPLTDFSDLTGRNGALDVHERASHHKINSQRAAEFRMRSESDGDGVGKGVAAMVVSANKQLAAKNRAVLSSIVKTLKLAAAQNIALRGHRDTGRIDLSDGECVAASNDGNFRHLLRFRADAGDAVLEEHLKSAPGNGQYISNRVQNELLKDMAELIKECVSKNVRDSPVWALVADETTDAANRELMTLVARYLDSSKDGTFFVREDPIAVVDAFAALRTSASESEMRLTGRNLARVIMEQVREANLDTATLVGQCYDGAASMSSERVGVAAEVLSVAPLAYYFHCAVHALNLSTSLINKVAIIRNALGAMERAVAFVTDGAKREELYRHTETDELESGQRRKLLKLCQTRFVERHTSVVRFWEELAGIVIALEKMATWQDAKTSSKASTHLLSVLGTEFLVGLGVVKRLAAVLRPLSQSLQENGADLVHALSLVDSVCDVLADLRENAAAEFEAIFSEVQKTADEIGAELRMPRVPQICRHRATAGQDQGVEGYFRINAFIPAVEAVLADLKARFGKHQRQSFALTLLLPANMPKTEWEQVQPLCVQYQELIGDMSETQLKAEFQVWKALCGRCEDVPSSAIGALAMCSRVTFPGVHRLLSVLAVMPVSSAEAERVFSKVTGSLTPIRAAMSEGRLEALVLIQAHRDRLPTTEAIISKFVASGARRLEFRLSL